MDKEEIKLMVKDCMNRAHKLSEWEFTFIDTMAYQLKYDPNYKFSKLKQDILTNTWEKVTA